MFEFASLEGDALIQANAHPSASNWKVGVAIKKAELQQAAWMAVRWAVMLGVGLSVGSVLLAWNLAQQIRGQSISCAGRFLMCPLNLANRLRSDHPKSWSCRTHSIAQRESGRTRTRRSWRLSNLEREMALRGEAQAALAQSQRMEAMGQLAGGVAHDFNNVLAAISTYLDAAMPHSADEQARKAIQGAMDAIEMGASTHPSAAHAFKQARDRA